MTTPITWMEILGTTFLALAVVHTFASSRLQSIASRFPEGSVGENFFHLVGEVEVIFGLWASFLILAMSIAEGRARAISYSDSLNFTEPLFVFAIMAVSATRPVLEFARSLIFFPGKLVPSAFKEVASYFGCLVLGPLLGSLITEPAAMTVTALMLRDRYFVKEVSAGFKYVTLAVLFVNVSIGGVLTPFAAPPVLMVASKWNWDLGFMLSAFGWKAAIAVVLNALGAAVFLRKELARPPLERPLSSDAIPSEQPAGPRHARKVPKGLVLIHLAFLGLIVLNSHHPVIFLGLFLLFLGVVVITREYQEEVKLKESLLVAFFLSGLVVLGGLQNWWLEPLIRSLDSVALFLGATALTAVTDNAALTYLGSQIEGVSPQFQYALVAGAVAGGGLTVIANAPNPAGFAILQGTFGNAGIQPLRLFGFALLPTLCALAAFWFL